MSFAIEKKIWPEYFEKILSGEKNYELRLADFNCEPGDILVLKEFNPEKQQYTGRIIEKTITYTSKWKIEDLEKFWKKEDIKKHGLQIISLK